MGAPAELQVVVLPCSNEFPKDLISAVKSGNETQAGKNDRKGKKTLQCFERVSSSMIFKVHQSSMFFVPSSMVFSLDSDLLDQVEAALERLIDPNVESLISEHDFQSFTPLYCAAVQGRCDPSL